MHERSLAIREKAQGRYSEAEPLHKRRLMIVEKALGSMHPDLAVALNNLALLYQRSRDFRCSVHFRHPCLCPAVLDMRRTSHRLKPGTWTPRFLRLWPLDANPLYARDMPLQANAETVANGR